MTDEIWRNITVIRKLFDLQMGNLQQRDVKSRPGPDGKTTEYELNDVVARCGDLIMKRVTPPELLQETHKLKEQVLAERVRKLRIENDVAEGVLVSALDVEANYTRSIRAVCDVLDSIPSRVKMEHPEIEQSDLDLINRMVIAVRNEAAALDFD